MFAVCAISGNPVRGAGLALSFALGTVPLLYLAQQQWGRLQRFALHRPLGRILHAGLVAVTFGVVLWRVSAGSLHPGSCCSLAPLP
jgi:sulfite exporter TauE/SafE